MWNVTICVIFPSCFICGKGVRLWLHGVCHRLSKNVLKNNLLPIALTFQNFMVLNDTNTVLHINNECYLSGS